MASSNRRSVSRYVAFPAVVGFAIALTACVPPAEENQTIVEQPRRPNVVLILADDIGVETIGAYGSEYATPRIDTIAANGVRFDNAHATPVCTPTRTRLMTGTHNFTHYKTFAHLDPNAFTVSEFMRGAGYRTMIAGKWQLAGNMVDKLRGTLPEEAGFDEHIVWYIEQNKKGGRYWGPTFVKNGERKTYCGDEFGPDILNDAVLDFIDRAKDKPFFVYYPMILAHDPWVRTPASLDADTTSQKFRGMMGYMDTLVGKVLDKLEENQLMDNTLVLFVGDNGTHTDITSTRNGVPVQGGKWFTADTGTHVPFLVQWNGRLPGGEVRGSLIEVMDIFPTLATAIGHEAPDNLDGEDLMPLMEGADTEVRDAIFMHYAPRWGSPHGAMTHARFAFDKHWKLYGDGRFYDLRVDIGETNSLNVDNFSSEAQAAHTRLQHKMKSMRDGPLSEPFQNPPVQAIELPEPLNCRE